MKKDVITFTSKDGLLLHGLYYNSNKSKSVIHVHGLAGSFYSSTYHDILAQTYSQQGYNYFSFNNRGSEFVKQLKNLSTGRRQYYGYTYEKFEEADLDILGAIEYLHQEGNSSFILQGHSSGCQKIIYTLSKHDIRPEKVILLSPCDDVGLALHHYGEEIFQQKINKALSSQEGVLAPDFFFDMPISKSTFLSHFGPDNKFDIFHYYRSNTPFVELENNKIKTLVVFGENDYVDDFALVKSIYGKISNYSIDIIPHADHKYKGCEERLASVLAIMPISRVLLDNIQLDTGLALISFFVLAQDQSGSLAPTGYTSF